MKMLIKKMYITNFKGIKSLEIPFQHVTDIFGENAEGKTTVFDAFTWLFFGKDSMDRKDFDIKPLDRQGKAIQKTDIEVAADIDVDGRSINVKKVMREKWVKKRGELDQEFTGNENLFFWNDVPLQLKQFQDKISDLLNENVFKLITNPLYFNSLKWQDRRAVLLEIAGKISNEELLLIDPNFQPLIKILSDKTLEEYKRETASKKKKLKDELSAIPNRIDEVNKQMPKALDYEALRKAYESKQNRVDILDESLQDANKSMQVAFDKQKLNQTKLHELEMAAASIKNDIRSVFASDSLKLKQGIMEKENELAVIRQGITSKENLISELEQDIEKLSNEKDGIAAEWVAANEEMLVFGDNMFDCPTCKRPLDADKIQDSKTELTNNFNTNRAQKLDKLLGKGTALKSKILDLQNTKGNAIGHNQKAKVNMEPIILELQAAKEAYQKYLSNVEAEFTKVLDASNRYTKALDEMTDMKMLVDKKVDQPDSSALKNEKTGLLEEMKSITSQLAEEAAITKGKARIRELETQESVYSQQLADIEGSEYLAEQFTKAKTDTLVKRINGRFRFVSFKMFEAQINGGELECCETMVPSGKNSLVPFSNANNAARINAGLDIINTLCEHYNAFAPIFIDNRESVTKLIDCESQIVNLFVLEGAALSVEKPIYKSSHLKQINRTQDEMDNEFRHLKMMAA